MALAVERLHPQPGSVEDILALSRLLAAIFTLPSVIKVTASQTTGGVHLWVFLEHDAPEADEDRVLRLGLNYRRAVGGSALRVHAIPLGELSGDHVPDGETLFTR